MSSGVSMLFFSFSEYALQYSQESFLGLWNEKLNSLQKTLLYAMDGAVIISSAVHFAREEKEHAKERAKVNQSVYAATFDLEAVLYTPCSNVSQIFY
jgi:hypothetical protein